MADQDFVPGDKRVAAAVVGAVLLAVGLWFFQAGFSAPDARIETLQDAEAALRSTFARARSAAFTGVAMNLGFSSYFVLFGIRIIQSQISPPPGWRVPFRVKVKRGQSALPIGWGCVFIGLLFLIRAVSSVRALQALS